MLVQKATSKLFRTLHYTTVFVLHYSAKTFLFTNLMKAGYSKAYNTK